MNCVWMAYVDHLKHLGIQPNWWEFGQYCFMKKLTHETLEERTFAGVVPWMYRALASWHGCVVEVEHRIWTPEHYQDYVRNWVAGWVVAATDYGREVEEFTLRPVVYLSLSAHHAAFADGAVPGSIMALQIIKEG